MERSIEKMLTTHAGSLPRPESLREMLVARQAGEGFDEEKIADESRVAVAGAVQQQIQAGISVVNDGESSKYSFSSYLRERLNGFESVSSERAGNMSRGGLGPGEFLVSQDFPEFFKGRGGSADQFARTGRIPAQWACTGPISWKDFGAVERDLENLTAATENVPGVEDVFMSAVSPGTVRQGFANLHYSDSEEFMHALADVLSREYKAIIDAGFVLQLDCPDLGNQVTESHMRAFRAGQPMTFSLEEYRREIALNVEAINYATKDLPPEQMRIHLCWGSTEYPHHLDSQIVDYLDILLQLRPAGLMVVAANGRHEHEWKVWEDVQLPEGKVVIPGVIDSTTNIIEHPKTVAQRIVRFAEVLGRENMIAGVDCGFQSSAGRDQVYPRVAWAKLRALGEGAELATKELWSR